MTVASQPTPDLEQSAYHRDASLGWVASRGPATFHFGQVIDATRTVVARCNRNLILVEDGPWPLGEVPPRLRCRRPACALKWLGYELRVEAEARHG